ncbi:hypothetical protein [Acaryochloris sp. IP29b_bin.148]|uniref:hypothetical protein n=1 Tax=Acaryochloris sp. IP29b_bin.148 TaxID=2969218 RepID=UPI00262817AE|nr:hypothetical protein [Acaryochloris sp. IP29b_bin.148]
MTPELEDLQITLYEIERLSGLEVSDHTLDGFLWGTYRLPLRAPGRLAVVITTEPLVLGLIVILATPLGLAAARSAASDQVVIMAIGAIAAGIWTLRQLRMRYKARQLRSFMRLFDEVDRYHQVLQAVELFGKLGATEQPQTAVLEALSQARDSLIAGLMTEKILRQNRGLLSRRQALLENIEHNLMTLQSLELQHQAQDYRDILDQAVEISIRVQDEVTRVSQLRSHP